MERLWGKTKEWFERKKINLQLWSFTDVLMKFFIQRKIFVGKKNSVRKKTFR